jgi:hypothetical protein
MNSLLIQLLKDYFDQEGFAVATLFCTSHKKHNPTHPQWLRVQRLEGAASCEPCPVIPFGQLQDLQLFSKDLDALQQAYVGAWVLPEASLLAGLLHSNAKISEYFKKKRPSPTAEGPFFGPNPTGPLLPHILVVPGLPKLISQRQEIFDYLHSAGIRGVLTLETILESLVRKVDNYRPVEHSPLLQLLQLLKVYERLLPAQLELF